MSIPKVTMYADTAEQARMAIVMEIARRVDKLNAEHIPNRNTSIKQGGRIEALATLEDFLRRLEIKPADENPGVPL